MKTESILNVLMYLFRNHMSEDAEINDLPRGKLLEHLEKIGFQRTAIRQAFAWLERLNAHTEPDHRLKEKQNLRVYNEYETEVLDIECRGFLHFLEQEGILSAYTRELVIQQALELADDDEEIDVSLIKWVSLMVLFNQPEEQNALQCMEFLVLDDTTGTVH